MSKQFVHVYRNILVLPRIAGRNVALALNALQTKLALTENVQILAREVVDLMQYAILSITVLFVHAKWDSQEIHLRYAMNYQVINIKLNICKIINLCLNFFLL